MTLGVSLGCGILDANGPELYASILRYLGE
jgi:hypothetical protein